MTASVRPSLSRNERVDRLGVFASSLCAAHCGLSALLPAAFGALGLGALLGHEAEWVFTLIAVTLGLGALVVGWRRHRSRLAAAILLLGVLGLLASRVVESSGEHGDHAGEHHPGAAEGEHQDEHAHEDEPAHADEHGEGGLHAFGTLLGVLAGGLLVAGHVLNTRAARSCSDPDC